MLIQAIAVIGLGLMSAASVADPAQPPEPIYTTHMYSDASHTEEVGTITGTCAFGPSGYYVRYALTGTATYYQVDEFVGFCPDTPL